MNEHDKHAQAGRSVFMSSISGLATILAALATFLLTPLMYAKSIDWIQSYTARYYGSGFEQYIAFGWWGICIFLIFFLARASIGTALVFGGLAIATRFL